MRVLAEHLANCARTMSEHARQCGLAKHGDCIGVAREALTERFLASHLPIDVLYLTGEIFDREDARSGQVDLILHPIGSPRLNLLDKVNLVFADSVLAAIEVKSNLTTASFGEASHLKAALDACVRIKRLSLVDSSRTVTFSTGKMISLESIPFMIFAFAGPTVDTLRAKVSEYMKGHGYDLSVMPDLITVLDREYYLVKNNGWLIDVVPGNVHYSHNQHPEHALLGMYAYLTKIIEVSRVFPRMTPFSDYLGDLTRRA